MITDFHTHAFPDGIAERAMQKLERTDLGVKAYRDGTVASLLASMDRAGIDRSVVCSIATRPEQFEPILRWSGEIASARIVALPSVHPADPGLEKHLADVRAAGYVGVKMHPYYQDFVLDDPRMDRVYATLADLGLLVVMHTGYDIAFGDLEMAAPIRVRRVIDRFPSLCFVATHMGGWQDWHAVREHLVGRPVHMEISYALGLAEPSLAGAILKAHPPTHLLFGTDSPWQDQGETLRRLRSLGLGAGLEAALLGGNAEALLRKS